MKEINDSEKRKEIDNEVIKLYEQNYNSAQIRKALLKKFTGMGESVPTIIDRLKKEGRISTEQAEIKRKSEKEKEEVDKLEIEKIIIQEYEKGISKLKIGRKVHLLPDELSKFIKELRKQGRLDEAKREQAELEIVEQRKIEREKLEQKRKEMLIEKERKRQQTNEKIIEMDKTGMDYRIIAENLGVSPAHANDIIKQYKGKDKLDEEKQKEERNKRILEMRDKTSNKRIAEMLAISESRVSQIIKQLKEENKDDGEKSTKEEEITGEEKSTSKTKIGKNYILKCRKISKENNEKQDTAKLRQSIELDYDKITMNDIIFVINVHLKQHEYENAIVFLNSLIAFEEMKQIDKSKLEEMKHSIEVNKVCQLLRKGLSKQDIESKVGLSGFEINKIANQVRNEQLAENEEDKQITGNEDVGDSSR